MTGRETVKDDGSNEVSDNEAKRSPLKKDENKVKTRVSFSEAENQFVRKHIDRYINSTKPLLRFEFTEYVSGREESKELVKKFGINKFFCQNAHREELQKTIFQCL